LYFSCYPEAGGKSAIGELFDAPDALDCYRRSSSIVPQQALALTNSELVHQASVAVVQAWQGDVDDTQRFIDDSFMRILGRSPSEDELAVCQEILDQQRQLATDPGSATAITQARESLTRILLNHNDFVTVR
jgi:hypothetical protein